MSATPQAVATPRVLPAPQVGHATVFRVQVGSFLNPRNAVRLVERLQGEGLDAAMRVAEGSRVLYRVLATPRAGENYEELLARLRALGFSPEMTDAAVAVTGFVPTEEADETASHLEKEAIPVRVESETGTAAYHIVRVGAYRTAEEAERARVELAARGLAGFVLREQGDGRGSD